MHIVPCKSKRHGSATSSTSVFRNGPKSWLSRMTSMRVLSPRFFCASLSLSAPRRRISLPFSKRMVSSVSCVLMGILCRAQTWMNSCQSNCLARRRLIAQMRTSEPAFSSATIVQYRAHMLVLPARRVHSAALLRLGSSMNAICLSNNSPRIEDETVRARAFASSRRSFSSFNRRASITSWASLRRARARTRRRCSSARTAPSARR